MQIKICSIPRKAVLFTLSCRRDKIIKHLQLPSARLIFTVPHPVKDASVPHKTMKQAQTSENIINCFGSGNKVVKILSTPAYRLFSLRSEKQINEFLSYSIQSRANVVQRSMLTIDIYILPSVNYLCKDARKSLLIDNAGGKSEISEMFSINYFKHVYGAYNTIFETEVNYWFTYKMVDFICTINGNRVGVSVARAMGYPSADDFTEDIAKRLLHKKLYGLIIARNGVVRSQSFTRSILHIWCQDMRIAKLIKNAYNNINPLDYGVNVKGIVIIQLTVCDDNQIYKNILI